MSFYTSDQSSDILLSALSWLCNNKYRILEAIFLRPHPDVSNLKTSLLLPEDLEALPLSPTSNGY
jgi:hypothetical protein